MKKPKPLNTHYDLLLHPTSPFNFEGTLHKPSHFPSSDNAYEGNQYWQTMRWDRKVFGAKIVNMGSIDSPKVRLYIFSESEISPKQLKEIATEIEYRFDMRTNLNEFYEDCGRDSLLGPVLKRWRGMRVSANASLYEFLVITTVLQNATVRRSVQMLENLFQAYGERVHYGDRTLSVFWTPKALDKVDEEELRALKVGYRAKTLKRHAQAFAAGEIDEFRLRKLEKEQLKAELLNLYGVGPASVWYLLFEVFKFYDAFEYISPWEQKIYSRLLFNKELVDARIILKEVNARWGKWRMLAAHYLFEDLFWQRKTQHIPWLEDLIRL